MEALIDTKKVHFAKKAFEKLGEDQSMRAPVVDVHA